MFTYYVLIMKSKIFFLKILSHIVLLSKENFHLLAILECYSYNMPILLSTQVFYSKIIQNIQYDNVNALFDNLLISKLI